MKFRNQISKAIGAHGHWKKRLVAAIETERTEPTVEQAAKDDRCELGKWLHGTSIPAELRRTADFEACRDLHAEFHKAAADALRLARSGNKAAALAAVVGNTKFANLSSALTLSMMKWAASAR